MKRSFGPQIALWITALAVSLLGVWHATLQSSNAPSDPALAATSSMAAPEGDGLSSTHPLPPIDRTISIRYHSQAGYFVWYVREDSVLVVLRAEGLNGALSLARHLFTRDRT